MNLGIFAHRSFTLLALSQTVSNVGTWVNYSATAWAMYELTNQPAQVGLIVLARTLPFIVLSLIGGSVADRWDRRKLLIVSQSSLAMLNAVLAVAFFAGRPPVELLYLVAIGTGIATAFDGPTMQATFPALVPRDQLVSALSFLTLSRHLGAISGPAIAGMVIAWRGPGFAFAIDALTYCVVIMTLFFIRWPSLPSGRRPPLIESIGAGLKFVISTPIILILLSLDFLATFFAQPMALLPVIAKDVLGLGAEGYGILGGAVSAGAITGSITLTLARGRLPARLGTIVLATVIYGLGSVFLGLSTSFGFAFAALVIMGFGDVISETMRSALLQLSTPDEYRGRLSAVSMIFVRGGPSFGQVRAGTVAGLFGPGVAAVSGGILCALGSLYVLSQIRARGITEPEAHVPAAKTA